MRWNSLRDGRGVRRTPLALCEAARLTGRDPDVLATRDDRARFWAELLWAGPLFATLMAVGQFLVVGWKDPIGMALFQVKAMPIYFVFCGGVVALVCSRTAWRSPHHARDAMLLHDPCPACAHGLDGIPAQDDGCVVCPECGAAWRGTTSAEPQQGGEP